jgi:hypothetical protein
MEKLPPLYPSTKALANSLSSSSEVLPYFDEQFLDDSFSNSDQTVSDLKNNPTETQLDLNQSNRI